MYQYVMSYDAGMYPKQIFVKSRIHYVLTSTPCVWFVGEPQQV